MFNIFGSLKRIFGTEKKNLPQDHDTPTPGNNITNKINQLSGFLSNKFQEGVTEYGVIRQKMQNLSKTNYDLAMKHLNNGNIAEAIFRFKIVKKFWPDNYDAYYQLAYCLILSKKLEKAKAVIQELIDKKSDYDQDKVSNLLEAIQNVKDSQDADPQIHDIKNNHDNN